MHSILNDFPSLENEPVCMLDARAGMHFLGVVFTMLGGYFSIGLDIDTTRFVMAATFLWGIVDKYPGVNVAISLPAMVLHEGPLLN